MSNNNRNFRIGIVIQGPILSVGGAGGSTNQVAFDSSEYILSQYRLSRSLNCETVIATWRTEDVSKLITIPTQDILMLEEYKHRFGNSFNNPHFTSKNKFRQFYSTLKGAEELVARGCDFIIKIRTDQLVDLHLLINFVNSFQNGFINEKIYLAHLNPATPNYVEDFYFCGTATAMIDFSRDFLSSREIHQNVHRDIFYKWVRLRSRGRGLRSLATHYYPQNTCLSKKQLELIMYGWEECFGVLPSGLWKSLQWRGHQYGLLDFPKRGDVYFSDSPSHNYFDDLSKRFIQKSRLFKLDTISILTYFFSSRVENFVRRAIDKSRKESKRLNNFWIKIKRKFLIR